MGKYTKPIGYIEKMGGYFIKKVSAYGKKYVVSKGALFWRFADLQQARKFVTLQLM